MSGKFIRYLFPMLLLIIIFTGSVVVTYNVFTNPYPGHGDFMSRWEGARSFFVDGVSPYSDEASFNIQRRMYGRPAFEHEDPVLFAYPFYTAFFVLPIVFMNYAWASAIWMVVLAAMLIVTLLLLLNFYKWRPSLWLLTILMFWAVADYFAARGLILGQFSHVVYFCQILAIWGVYRGRDELAGTVLAISTLKPQMSYLLIPFLLIWALRQRRWRFVGSFAGAFVLLMAFSFLLEPTWFSSWLEQIRAYPVYTTIAYPDTGSPVWIITQEYLGLGDGGEWIFSAVFIVPMLWAWYTVLVARRDERFLWAVMMTLLVTHLVAMRTATPHFVVFNLAILFYLKQVSRRYGQLAAAGIVGGLFVFSWVQFITTIGGRDFEHPVLFLPLPLTLFAIVWVTREMWWRDAPQIAPQYEPLPLMPVQGVESA
jgi:hypothetical protein